MSDISRNDKKKIVKVTDPNAVPVNETKDNNVQIHFGNAKIVELKLLESINRHLVEVVKILREAKDNG